MKHWCDQGGRQHPLVDIQKHSLLIPLTLTNFEQIQFKHILFEPVSDPCCLECHMNLFSPGCARLWGSPPWNGTPVECLGPARNHACCYSHTEGLRVAGPHRNTEKPCYSTPYSLAHSQHWGGSFFSPLPLGLTWSLQGRKPLPRNSFSQLHVTTPGRERERMHLGVGGRELWSFHSLTKCFPHSTPHWVSFPWIWSATLPEPQASG